MCVMDLLVVITDYFHKCHHNPLSICAKKINKMLTVFSLNKIIP